MLKVISVKCWSSEVAKAEENAKYRRLFQALTTDT